MALLCRCIVIALPIFGTEYSSITGVFADWMEVEKALSGNPAENGALLSSLMKFRLTLEAYTESPLFMQYEGAVLFSLEQKQQMMELIETFAESAARGNMAEAAENAVAIRSTLVFWQHFEVTVSNTVFAKTFSLFVFFILIIAALIYFLWHQQSALQYSRRQNQEAADLSRRIILAQEAERSRISMEIHDTVLQDLGRLMQLTEEYGAKTGQGSEAILAMEDRLITQLRMVCRVIMPPNFSRLLLADSLMQLCFDFEKRTRVKCQASISEDISAEGLQPDMQLQCFRIVQEALTNIEKHAHATEVSLTVRNSQKGERPTLLIILSDDGCGIEDDSLIGPYPLSAANRAGEDVFGIRGMYERTSILKGDLAFINEIGQGLTVRIEIPLGISKSFSF
ncbi:conserved hypothetical protein [Treponema primitia ZAS-2]|uniref:histidine kinase n=1 Tax=Treponema primitia (strain ATCC BAA-887 / DSM 12427 / ZAS-2) TaxID=545694 RepID=F5YLR5_TREPZ|nr:ATP-binding protein [Treponema primitia]AEF84829.1 conserved hypothetical protein [Treponema primitia ZAS-2]